MLHAADLLDRVNAALDDRHLAVGPSHFMRDDLDDEWIRLIWKHSILPYLEEHFAGQRERLDEFKLDRLLGDEQADRRPTPDHD